MKKLALYAVCVAAAAFPALAREEAKEVYPSPGEIVAAAKAEEWVPIPPADLMVMDLAKDRDGKSRRVVIQLMPAPFSQGWVGNIRKLVAARWYDGVSVNRVQDNYVVQWGDATEKKALPEGLAVVPESEYTVDERVVAEFTESDSESDSEPEDRAEWDAIEKVLKHPSSTEEEKAKAIEALLDEAGLSQNSGPTDQERIQLISIEGTQSANTSQGWHERDSFSEWVEIWKGWPIANFEKRNWYGSDDKPIVRPTNTQRHVLAAQGITSETLESYFWPIHCYGMVGVGRNLSPDTGSGAELYTVIGHAPRHLDRNIALVGRVIEGIEHLSSLPRGTGALGFYEKEEERVPIVSVRMGNETADIPAFEYLSTDGETFAAYADARANRRDPFFNIPAGGADICNIPVPVRRSGK